MCGRYLLDVPGSSLAQHFAARNVFPEFSERYNAAPSQLLPVLVPDGTTDLPGEDGDLGGEVALVAMRWGLLPGWAQRPGSTFRPQINARAETVADKPAFRSAFARRRCLVPVSGFYEWKAMPGSRKQPHCLRMRGGGVFTLAGIFEPAVGDQPDQVATFAILTTTPNELAAPIHDRMPVIIGTQDRDAWLDAPPDAAPGLTALFAPWPADEMEAFPVSTLLNDVHNDSPDILAPVSPA